MKYTVEAVNPNTGELITQEIDTDRLNLEDFIFDSTMYLIQDIQGITPAQREAIAREAVQDALEKRARGEEPFAKSCPFKTKAELRADAQARNLN